MIRNRFALVIGLTWLAWSCCPLEIRAQDDAPANRVFFRIKAEGHDRQQTPIRFELPEDRFGPAVRKALERGPVALSVTGAESARRKNEKIGPGFPAGWPAQAERDATGNRVRVTFILRAPLLRAEEARYQLDVSRHDSFSLPTGFVTPWSFDQSQPGGLVLKHRDYWVAFGSKPRDQTVFRYNAAPVSSPNYGPIQNRDAYIHPAYSPSGALITGDFSTSHPHHRGFFLAYERTKSGDLTPDFWNIHVGTGKIYTDELDKPVVGLITARFSARHRWEAKDKATGKDTVVLRERWDVEAYAILGAPYWLFDITSTQQAVDRPLELLPYRYGGMAYRGPEPFVKGTLDVLTSDGKHRKDGDQKPARWVDLTGPIADGSEQYAGAMIADHPSNPNYPNVARIHPTTLPFFCYVPSHDKPLTIAVDTPSVFRYRVLIHDGKPDARLDERVARDFAEPPVVVVE